MVVGHLGETTNNTVELMGLLQGLQVAISRHSHRLIMEADSQFVIQLITKILHGEDPQKISPSWRLSGLLEEFKNLLRANLNIIPSHVKREANRVADCLANGVTKESEHIYWEAHSSEVSDISGRCQVLANKDLQPSDGVPRGGGRTRGTVLGGAINGGHRLPSPRHK